MLGAMEGLFGIGQLARVSGLTVSALRFYDGAGVLEPAFTSTPAIAGTPATSWSSHS